MQTEKVTTIQLCSDEVLEDALEGEFRPTYASAHGCIDGNGCGGGCSRGSGHENGHGWGDGEVLGWRCLDGEGYDNILRYTCGAGYESGNGGCNSHVK